MMSFDLKIVRSPSRKRLTITIERDKEVVVHVPANVSDDRVRRIVDEKRQWVLQKLNHPQKYQRRKHPPGKEVVNGESAPYLGRDYRIEVADTPSGEVELEDVFRVPTMQRTRRRKVLRDWYVARANEDILPRVKRHAKELGVEYARAKIVDNRYRWGSCTPRRSLNFNWRLIKAPMFVVDYVIVHELAHLIEPNHTAQFWSIVRASSPTMEKAKTWLLEHGQMLEEEL